MQRRRVIFGNGRRRADITLALPPLAHGLRKAGHSVLEENHQFAVTVWPCAARLWPFGPWLGENCPG
jgi:hypothetical protein